MIILLRRAGKLEEVSTFLTAAEKNDKRCFSHPGFHYCTYVGTSFTHSSNLSHWCYCVHGSGLYARFTNDVGRAISELNLARKDEQWGPAALTHMVELYLNPDQEGVWEEKEGVSDCKIYYHS